VELELPQEIAAMGLDGFDADSRLHRDFLVRFSIGERPQNFDFTQGELFDFGGFRDFFIKRGDLARAKGMMPPERFERGLCVLRCLLLNLTQEKT
jgi:hypothetical protein